MKTLKLAQGSSYQYRQRREVTPLAELRLVGEQPRSVAQVAATIQLHTPHIRTQQQPREINKNIFPKQSGYRKAYLLCRT